MSWRQIGTILLHEPTPIIPRATMLEGGGGGGILDSPCLSVCPLTFRVRPVASTVQDGFFPYLVKVINSMRRCVACVDPWPWPISSRSFGIDLENRVRSVASSVLDGLFLYLVQMITSMRRCVACGDLWPWPISSRSFDLDFENSVRSVTFSVLDRLFPYFPQIISTIRGCVACYVYNKILKFQFFANFSNFFGFHLEKNLQFCLQSFHI